MTLPFSLTLKTIPSIQTIIYKLSKGRFCHSEAAWLTLLVIIEIAEVGKHSVNPVFQLVSSGATFVAKSYVESKIICVSLFPLRE